MTRVLVVHHDIDMADIEVDDLRRAGFEVEQCRGPIGGGPCPVLNGERCWQVDRADVLVYDVWASGDSGLELIGDVRDIHPGKPVVLTSPSLVLDWVETAGPHGVTPLPGPPSGPGLVAAVEAALAASVGAGGGDKAPSADADRVHSAAAATPHPHRVHHW